MNEVAISFILPVYNVALYLADAMESILRQEVSKEIILVDDGSTDSSLAIALDYARKYPFIYVIHSQNKGVSAARNAGLKLARGEYVMFLDADDVLHSEINLKVIYQFAIANNINVIKGQYQTQIDDIIYSMKPIYCNSNNKNIASIKLSDFFKQSLPANWFIHITCFFLKRTYLLKENLYFDESLSHNEDVLFNVNLLSSENLITEIPFIFFIYQMRKNSAMTQPISLKRLDSQKRMIEMLIQRLKQNTPYIEQIKKVIKLTCEQFIVSIENNPQYNNLITAEIRDFAKSIIDK